MASYNTSEFRKGLKVQIDGDPYLMIECNFVKPGKGQAMYKCRLRNLIRNTVLDRTYKSGDSIEAADIEEIAAQYLYRQGDQFVFMDNETYEQYELTAAQVDDAWKYLKEGMKCSMILFNGSPLTLTPPNHVVLKVEYCEPGAKGNTASNVTKPVKVETGAEMILPLLRRNRRSDQGRYPNRRVHRTGQRVAAGHATFVGLGATAGLPSSATNTAGQAGSGTRRVSANERQSMNTPEDAAETRPTSPGDFRPTAGWDALRLRARLLRTVRAFFDDRGFLEVETPLLSADTVVDRHLDPFAVDDRRPAALLCRPRPSSA